MSNTSQKRLGDLLNFKRGYDLPASSRRTGPYPVVSSAGISGSHDEYKAEGEGVITGRYGTLGEVHYVQGRYWPHNTALYVTDFKGNVPKYLYYLLSQIGHVKTSDKSAVPGINRNDLHEVQVPAVTCATEQARIASILSALDAKIELNNRINEELEGMAKLLYDYWFVQFDFPMTAAQAAALGKPHLTGHPYRASGGKMIYNETLKREIPEGWEASTLGELYELYQPKTITESELNPDGKYLVYGANGIVGRYDSFNHADSMVALTCRGSTCGTLTQTLPNSWITGNAMVMKPRADAMCIDFTINQARRAGIHSIITGSGQPQITRANLEGLKVIRPDLTVLTQYRDVCSPGRFQRLLLTTQNQELTQLRDWLLPMLMNGQVTVGTNER
jgi:type I restriction enzyme S subunit